MMPSSPNSDPAAVRLAVIGAGTIGRKHVETIRDETACTLVAIADPDPAAGDVAAGYGVECFSDFAAMLSAVKPDGVELATAENPSFPPTYRNTHRFTGTIGALECPDLAVWKLAGDIAAGRHAPMERYAVPYTSADAYQRQLDDCCAVIRGEEMPFVSAEDGARTLAATVAVFEAAESGRRVVL